MFFLAVFMVWTGSLADIRPRKTQNVISTKAIHGRVERSDSVSNPNTSDRRKPLFVISTKAIHGRVERSDSASNPNTSDRRKPLYVISTKAVYGRVERSDSASNPNTSGRRKPLYVISTKAVYGRVERSETLLAQISPLRVHFINQHFLFTSAPSLELLFPCYSVFNIMTAFTPYKLVHVILFRKSCQYAGFMLVHSSGQIVRDAYV